MTKPGDGLKKKNLWMEILVVVLVYLIKIMIFLFQYGMSLAKKNFKTHF